MGNSFEKTKAVIQYALSWNIDRLSARLSIV